MKDAQRLIKYVAMAFAIFLVFNIVTTIMFGVMTLGNIFYDDGSVSDKLESLKLSTEATTLNIDVTSSDVVIKEGATFKVESSSENIKSTQSGNQININEEDHNWFFGNHHEDVIVYVPKGFVFDAISLHAGAGKIKIDELYTKKLFLDQGAGKLDIAYLEVSESAQIEGGAGKVSISDGSINHLDLKMGAGKLSLTSKINGSSKIDSGLGKLDLTLIGKSSDYQIKVEQGIGSINVDGFIKKDQYFGDGINFIAINGGIGSIDVQLK